MRNRKWFRHAFVGAVAVVLLAACGGGNSKNASASSTSGPAVSTTSSTSASKVAPKYHFEAFSAPSMNIGCYATSDEVRCDVGNFNWPTAPPKPADCEEDWGGALVVGTEGTGHLACIGDTTLGPTDVVPYGEANQVGTFVCKSETEGMVCTNETTKHGFAIARTSYRVF